MIHMKDTTCIEHWSYQWQAIYK